MDSGYSLQDVVRCHLCETPEPPLHCDICDKHLCKECEKTHISGGYTEHKLVPFKLRGCIIKCQKHSSKICDRYCEQCHISVCERCTSTEHRDHQSVDVVRKLESQKQILLNELQELENSIYPKYKEFALYNKNQKTDMKENSQKLTSAINKHGEDLHREIDTAVKKLKSELIDKNSIHLDVLNKQEEEINHTISEILQIINDLNKLLISNDVTIVSAYRSRNAEFRKLPPKHEILALPNFIPQKINKGKIEQQIGSLSELSIKTEYGLTIESPGDDSSVLVRPLIDIPRIISDINTEFEGLCSVSCLNDEEIWTYSYKNNIIKLYNLQQKLVKSIQTKSGYTPSDITVTRSGNLIYTDVNDKTVNIVKNTQIHTLIRPQGWRPLGVCSTSSGDLLVVMDSDDDDHEQSKVVRYTGSTEKQIIQYYEEGKPLYSFGYNKYISENRNLDICVSDYNAHVVVVVSQAGELRFIYTGSPSTTKRTFHPAGITTDSKGRILTADHCNNCIHILDQYGQLLRFIDRCDLEYPWGLCVDTRDNLLVTENMKGHVKKIQYYV